jgi:hypothetical protein
MWNPQADERKIRQTLARDLFGKDAERVLEAADQVATLLLQHNEHGKTPQPVRQAIFDELGNIAESIAGLPLPTLAVLTLAWIYAIETDAEAECLNKLLELLAKQNHQLEKFCDCNTLQKRYQFRLKEISK